MVDQTIPDRLALFRHDVRVLRGLIGCANERILHSRVPKALAYQLVHLNFC